MKAKRIAAETLIDIAAKTVRDELAPGLTPDKRYIAAMVAKALDIARREILTDGESTQWAMLDKLYDDGEGSLKQLAADIRAGKISEKSHPTLATDLRKLLVGELAVRNPQFLKGALATTPAAR
jgi:hypothetical protein